MALWIKNSSYLQCFCLLASFCWSLLVWSTSSLYHLCLVSLLDLVFHANALSHLNSRNNARLSWRPLLLRTSTLPYHIGTSAIRKTAIASWYAPQHSISSRPAHCSCWSTHRTFPRYGRPSPDLRSGPVHGLSVQRIAS